MPIISSSVIGSGSVVEPSQKGDIVTFSNTPVNLGIVPALDGKVLTQKSTEATGLEWKSPVNTKGGLLTSNGTNTVELTVGNIGQVLTKQPSAGLGLVFNNPAFPFLTTKGDLLASNGSDTQRLVKGTVNGEVLTVDSTQTDTNLKYKLPVSTKGGLLTSAGNNSAVLPVGTTDGDVLTADSNETLGMKWANPTAGSNFIWVNATRVLVYDQTVNSGEQNFPFLNGYTEFDLNALNSNFGNYEYKMPQAGKVQTFRMQVIANNIGLSATAQFGIEIAGTFHIQQTLQNNFVGLVEVSSPVTIAKNATIRYRVNVIGVPTPSSKIDVAFISSLLIYD